MSGIEASNRKGEQEVLLDSHVVRALEVIHDSRSTNALRQEASRFLEGLKTDEKAPYHGFGLASANDQSTIVRHYGLSMIDYAVRHRWAEYSQDQSKAIRQWVQHLAFALSEQDPPFIANKIAAIWVEMAKRSWALDWMDMDELLVRLWEGQVPQQKIVLVILEALSVEVFGSEDSVAALRGNEFSRACVEIFTPANVLAEQFPNRESIIKIRYGEEGWLARMADALQRCVNEGNLDQDRQAIVKGILSTTTSAVNWLIPGALVATSCVHRLCACLAVSEMSVQLAAIDTLYALYNRSRFSEDDSRDIVGPMFMPDILNLLKQLYDWLLVDPADIDDSKYLLLKRFSEMLYNIGRLLTENPSYLPQGTDLESFLHLVLHVMRNDSLQVSIPAMHLWVKILMSDIISKSPVVSTVMGELLEACSHRLVRYESLPEDSNLPSILFLNEDIESVPEKHAFLGNYSRFCNQVVELVVQKQPIDALYHILGQADHVLNHVYDGAPPFDVMAYSKSSVPSLKIDAQFSVIEAALKGCLKWLTSLGDSTIEHEHEVMIANLQVWCNRLLGLTFEDPMIKERVIQLAVGFAVGPLKRDAQFAVKIFDHILEIRCPRQPESLAYSDAVRDLQAFSVHHLQRLAMRFADHLVTIYNVVEQKIRVVCQEMAFDEHTKARYNNILFVIIHRATSLDPALREERLEQFLRPLVSQWQDDRLAKSLSSFDQFSALLGLNGLQLYLSSRAVHKIEEWSSHPLDEEGRLLQKQMQDAVDDLPLRATKQMMSISIEKLEQDSQPYMMACRLWHKNLPFILPSLLQLISQSQAFHDPANWANNHPDLEGVVRRIFTDRFWQVGISQGTRDDFYATVGGTKTTMEGFASSIRATVRTVRETGYRILYYMSLLGDKFYGFQDLPEPLSRALFTDACALSPHQMAILVDVMRPIIENCPEKCRSQFLPPIVSALFEQVDRKASSEWERIEERTRAAGEGDDLAKEMKDESVLRQLTMASVMCVVGLLEPPKPSESCLRSSLRQGPKSPDPSAAPGGEVNGSTSHEASTSLRDFILQTPNILKPIVLFCMHALRMRDTRSCSLIAKVLRTLVNEFTGDGAVERDVREFISTEVLKACITSLNDPYFVELQRDFAQLIASILVTYGPRTETPKQVLQSLPGMETERLDRAVRQLFRAQSNSRQQRAIVLELLQGFRGIAIHEQGRLPKQDPKKLRSAMQQKYMTADSENQYVKQQDSPDVPDLEGLADMFG